MPSFMDFDVGRTAFVAGRRAAVVFATAGSASNEEGSEIKPHLETQYAIPVSRL